MTTLETISKLFGYLLPVIGSILMIFLILLVKKITETLKGVDKTIEDVDRQIQKLDDPLATVIDLCHTIDDVHHKSKDAVKKGSAQYKEKKEVIVTTVAQKREAFAKKIEEFKARVAKDETVESMEKEALELLDSQETKDNRELIESAKHKIIDIYSAAREKVKASNKPEKIKEILVKAQKSSIAVFNATKDKLTNK